MYTNLKFYNRQEELSILNKLTSSEGLKFIVVYGRRRIGKTRLIQEFLTDKEYAYVFVPKDKTVDLLLDELSSSENIPKFTSVLDLLRFLIETKKYVFFDEFQNFYYMDKSIYSDFQKLIDEYKHKAKNISLLVSGSSFSLMKKILGDYSYPLYGRADIMMKLPPLDMGTVMEMLYDIGVKDISEMIKFYAVFGGVPKYYEYIDRFKPLDFESAIKTMFFDRRMPFLKDEGKAVLISEFGGEYKIYFSILEAIASGKTTVGEIANIFEGKSGTASRYLDLLRNEYELVRRETPITDDPRKSRIGVYRLNDNFLKFWFAFVKRYESYYEQGRVDELQKIFFENYEAFVGQAFEDVSKEFCIKKNSAGSLPFRFDKIGKWWGSYIEEESKKAVEIDLVALNEKSGEMLFIECKWQTLKLNEARMILEALKKKSKFVSWKVKNRVEYFGIVGKTIEGKDKLREKGYLVFDIRDIESLWRLNK
jgi:AAA+ ATPase superfamily predicted ATPase